MLSIKQFEATKVKFDKMNSEEQWNWIFKNKEKIEKIILDNDSTQVVLSVDKPNDDEEDYSLRPDDFLGHSDGVRLLLYAMGIDNELV